MAPEKIQCPRQLFILRPISIAQLHHEAQRREPGQNFLEFREVVFSRREHGRKLKQEGAEFVRRTQRLRHLDHPFEQGALQFRAQCHPAFLIGFRRPLQIGRKRLHRRSMPREQAMQLDVKNEFVRRGAAPALDEASVRDRVEGRVHLHHLEMLRVPRKAIGRGQFWRIPALDKTGIRPARRSDANFYGPGSGRWRHGRGKARRRRNATAIAAGWLRGRDLNPRSRSRGIMSRLFG